MIETLGDPDLSPLAPREKRAIRFAEKMTEDQGSFRQEDIDALLEDFRPAEIVEIASVVGIFNYLNRFAEAFGLAPTQPGEGGPEGDRE